MKFEFNWPSSFRGRMFENVEGRTTDAGVTGIQIAHLRAFGSGELKTNKIRNVLPEMSI